MRKIPYYIIGFLLLCLVLGSVYHGCELRRRDEDYQLLSEQSAGLVKSVNNYYTTTAQMRKDIAWAAVQNKDLKGQLKRTKQKLVEAQSIKTKRDTIYLKGKAELRTEPGQELFSIDHTVKGININGFFLQETGEYDLGLIIPPIRLDIYLTEGRYGTGQGYIKSDAEFLKIDTWQIHRTPIGEKKARWLQGVLGVGYGKAHGAGFSAGVILFQKYNLQSTLHEGGPTFYANYVF